MTVDRRLISVRDVMYQHNDYFPSNVIRIRYTFNELSWISCFNQHFVFNLVITLQIRHINIWNAEVNLLNLLQNKIMLLFGFKVYQFNVFRFKSLRFKSESASLQKWVINVLLRLEYENFVLIFTKKNEV